MVATWERQIRMTKLKKGASTGSRVGNSPMVRASFSHVFQPKFAYLRLRKLVAIWGWPNPSDCWTSTASPGSSLPPWPPRASSVILGPWSSPLRAPSKKTARGILRTSLSCLLRQTAARPRFFGLRRQTRRSRLASPLVAVVRKEYAKPTTDWLADHPLYTKRFAAFVCRRCRETTVKEVAEDLFLDWETVKELDKQYMREQFQRAGNPAPRVIAIDEIAIAKGHQYRIVVSGLERGRPIWLGGQDRSEASLDEFFTWLGPEKCGQIRLAVMDMWPAFRNSTLKEGNAPRATILYDKFHILDALERGDGQVRKREYRRPSGVIDVSSKGRGTRCCRTGGTLRPMVGRR